jgi:beta-lactamase class A
MCSTHKALSAAAILARVDRGEERLDRRLRFSPDAVLPYSPGTQAHAGEEGMTIAAICEAAMTLSDNTAANLMLGAIGGPAGLTDFLRRHGDDVTRLDRTEPSLNEALPGDPRDTTSPFAMAATLDRLVLGDVLAPASRETLIAWLVAGKTGGARLRAGVPQDWRVGEKTGTGDNGTANDIGLFWPPQRKSPHGNNRFMWRPFPARWRLLQRSGYFRGSPKPVIVTAFLTGSTASREAQSAAIADVARTVVAMLQA